MSRGPESKLTSKILLALRAIPHSWWIKVPGGPMLKNGVPDILGVVSGQFVAIEVKHPHTGHKVTEAQAATLDKLRDAGASAGVAYSVEEALALAGEEP